VAATKEIAMNGPNRTDKTWKNRLGMAAAVVTTFVLGAETGGAVDLADLAVRGGEKDRVAGESDPESEVQ
jgi:hypothetical protein